MNTDFPFDHRVSPIGFYPLPVGKPNHRIKAIESIPEPIQRKENLLYVHIPFCKQRCSFCFFYNYLYSATTWDTYFFSLKRNLFLLAQSPFVQELQFSAAFIGGGSPNCLSTKEMSELSELLSKHFDLEADYEISLEWHPSDCDKTKLRNAFNAGINRLSFGVQTFNNELSKTLNLIHRPEQSCKIIETAMDIGFENVNIDLISCIPGETKEQFLQDIQYAHRFQPGGITVNPLKFIPHTPLYNLYKPADHEALNFSKRVEIISLTNDTMRNLGYLQQGFYNFHLPGKRNKYNHLCTKPFRSIVSAGTGAYGIINNYVYLNYSDLERYLSSIEKNILPVLVGNNISPDELKRKYIIMCLLDTVPFGSEYESAFGVPVEEDFGDILANQVERGFLKRQGTDYMITGLGKLWGDNVCVEYFSDKQAGLHNQRFDEKVQKYHLAPSVKELE